MNHSILTADRNAHLRMVTVSLSCAIVFVAAMIGMRVATFDAQTLRAESPLVVKANQPTAVTNRSSDVTVR